jgi:class 3 adenylate cyclase/HAMP domain-containing protein
MNIRTKILLLVLPLIITPLLLSALVSSYAARNGISQIAVEFLRYKAEELQKYADGQWDILRENGLSDDPYFVDIAKQAVAGFASSSVRGPTELIAAFSGSGGLEMSSADFELQAAEAEKISALASSKRAGWQRLSLGGAQRVAMAVYIEPFDWYLVVSEREDRFYAAVDQIVTRTVLLIAISATLSTLLLVVFSQYLTVPLKRLADTMTTVMESNDLSLRAEVLYADEIGKLSSSFNGMAAALDEAYGQIKSFAFEAALSQRRERKVRNIFQKYVPVNVIEQFFSRPESQLIGDERILSVLFSDIVGFTGISERLKPAEVVESLNHYFDRMVNIIMGNAGIVDKYMGDAIMAFFGAPSSTGRDALNSVTAGLEMREALDEFNAWQQARSRPPFFSGIGINHGKVTIGNIGSDKKMDYTVIGDMVNIASRVEGLTRYYQEPLLVSGSVYKEVRNVFPCRLMDRVAVKGRQNAIYVFSVQRDLSPKLEKAWKYYHAGMKRYYARQFDEALKFFRAADSLNTGDPATERFILRCQDLIKKPPSKDWTGIVVMQEK